MKVLFLSRWYPQPPDNGSKVRISNLLRGLCENHRVTLLSFHGAAENPALAGLRTPGPEEIHVCRFREFNPRSLRALAGFLSSAPRHLIDTYSPEMERLIRQSVGRTRFDLVIASQLSMASYHRAFRGIPAVLEEEELAMYCPWEGGQDAGQISLRSRLAWAKHKRYLRRLLRNFRLCTVASEQERLLLAGAVPDYQPVHVVPNTIDLALYGGQHSDRAPNSLIFCGSLSYGPNHDAMLWFLREVYPAIKAAVPCVRLTITGEPGAARRPGGPDVVFSGRVDDIRPLVGGAAVSVAPIRQGGGTRLKIIESMALRTPVVTTAKGAEGLEARDGVHLRIADDPLLFAQAVVSLLKNPQEGKSLADRAYSLVCSRYDSRVVVPRFLRLIDQAGRGSVAGEHSGRHGEPATSLAGKLH